MNTLYALFLEKNNFLDLLLTETSAKTVLV